MYEDGSGRPAMFRRNDGDMGQIKFIFHFLSILSIVLLPIPHLRQVSAILKKPTAMSRQKLTRWRKKNMKIGSIVLFVFFKHSAGAFSHFPIIRELELPLNGLRGIKVDCDQFPYLEVGIYQIDLCGILRNQCSRNLTVLFRGGGGGGGIFVAISCANLYKTW